MPSTPNYDNRYEEVAKLLSSSAPRAASPSQSWQSILPTGNASNATTPTTPLKRESDGNLGQAFIDILTSGSYATAGIGQKIGENFQAVKEGNIGGALDYLNPFSIIPAAVKGNVDKRVWADNLRDMGVDDKTAVGAGLALDIALDPLWLVPGGAFAAGIKGTYQGARLASSANRAGVKLERSAMDKAGDLVKDINAPRIKAGAKPTTVSGEVKGFSKSTGKSENEVVGDLFEGGTGQKLGLFSPDRVANIAQGIRQGNIDNYSNLWAQRAQRKVFKQEKKAAKIATKAGDAPLDPAQLIPVGGVPAAMAAKGKVIPDEFGTPGEKAANTIDDTLDVTQSPTAGLDELKEATPGFEETVDAAGVRTVYDDAASTFGKGSDDFIKANKDRLGLDEVEYDFKAVKANPRAVEMAQVYAKLVNDPTNPEVIKAYNALKEESAEQFRYLTEDMGVKIEYVKNDPYNVIKNGKSVPDSTLMMRDVTENKRLLVRDSTQDFITNPHPILTIAENNAFRAVHEFFGHVSSGTNFAAAGEEAAWLAHSRMYSAEARRAMTTETRGQNSYYNFYDAERKTFAPQKAALMPDEFVLAPAEYARYLEKAEGVTSTPGYVGVVMSNLVRLADRLLDDGSRLASPVAMSKQYAPAEVTKMTNSLKAITGTKIYSAASPQVKSARKILDSIRTELSKGTALGFSKGIKMNERDGVPNLRDLTELIQKNGDVSVPEKQMPAQVGGAMLKQQLDEIEDVTDLLTDALAAEGRPIGDLQPFKPTIWDVKPHMVLGAKYGKPEFSSARLQKYFAKDPLLADEAQMAIAMGTAKTFKVYIRKGESKQMAMARRQSQIWDSFRARNEAKLKSIVDKERSDWIAENTVANSELFIKAPDGTFLGRGELPASIPPGSIQVVNGRPVSSVGKMLDSIRSVINRPSQYTVAEYPEALQKWVLGRLKAVDGNLAKGNVEDLRFRNDANAIEEVAARLWKDNKFIASMADARLVAQLGAKGVAQLAKKPKMEFFVNAPVDRLIGAPDVAKIGRKEAGKVEARDPYTGQPLTGDAAETFGEASYRILDNSGKTFDGLTRGQYVSQLSDNGRKLGLLQEARATLGSISEGISSGKITGEAGQAEVLTSIMNSLGIKTAETASPAEIFKAFKNVPARFEEVVRGIESAAKVESLAPALRNAFGVSAAERVSLLKAIDRIDIAEVTETLKAITDDAIDLLDATCGGARSGPSLVNDDILTRVLGGLGG